MMIGEKFAESPPPPPLPATRVLTRRDAPFMCLRNFSLLRGPLFYVRSNIYIYIVVSYIYCANAYV